MLDKFLDLYCSLLGKIIAILLALMVVLVFGNVVLRYGFMEQPDVPRDLDEFLQVESVVLEVVAPQTAHRLELLAQFLRRGAELHADAASARGALPALFGSSLRMHSIALRSMARRKVSKNSQKANPLARGLFCFASGRACPNVDPSNQAND